MTGPTSTIVSKIACSEEAIALIHDIMDRMATERDDDEMKITWPLEGDGPKHTLLFGYEILPIEDSNYYPAEDLDRFDTVMTGFPEMEVNRYATGNTPDDHRVLGQLSLEIAIALQGIIDFHGALPKPILKACRAKSSRSR